MNSSQDSVTWLVALAMVPGQGCSLIMLFGNFRKKSVKIGKDRKLKYFRMPSGKRRVHSVIEKVGVSPGSRLCTTFLNIAKHDKIMANINLPELQRNRTWTENVVNSITVSTHVLYLQTSEVFAYVLPGIIGD